MSLFSEETREFMNLMKDKIIADQSIPEFLKIGFRLSDAHTRIRTKLDRAYLGFGNPPACPDDAQKSYSERKEFLEYLLLMEAGLDSFLEAHPAPPVPGYMLHE